MQGAFRLAELAKAVGCGEENQPSASQQRLQVKTARAERAGEVRETARPSHCYNLLTHFQSFEDESEEFCGSFFLADNQLAAFAR